MDQAKRGSDALANGDFTAAVSHYSDALKQNPTAVDYYIKRSIAYTRISPSDHSSSLKDAELAVILAKKRAKRELIAQAQLRRAIALFGLERWADSGECLEWVRKLDMKEKSAAIWEMKVAGKLKGLPEDDDRKKPSVTEFPDVEIPTVQSQKPGTNSNEASSSQSNSNAASTGTPANTYTSQNGGVQTPPNKIRHEWYQSNDAVIVSLFAKGIPKDKAVVDIKSSSLDISFPLPNGSDYNLSIDPLFSTIDPSKSTHKIMTTKAEFTLMKEETGRKWANLEGIHTDEPTTEPDPVEDGLKRAVLSRHPHLPAPAPAYPTSSKSGPKDWDKVASDLTKKPKKDDEDGHDDGGIDDEEGDPVNGFFKTLYKGASDDTRRAMMKSYQESNGTALSTNWGEVSKGKVETTPPDGMEAKKW
ncbi:uncharacterized protein KY384_005163 [Bacidia gigantensis]|uniref:uncharacterized protein n=1 Tax=Bacidia gigantensis TaxID=2732470 RepID=UPI001D047D45|nr:uncharacterized protein KY384_005163 [Bacidia gigantensis]KAG8529682.1 hypothetical protein KY384_005163 [Bacidia gigantensis]